MKDIQTVKRLKEQVKEYGLSGETFLSNFTDAEIAEAYNGIGPEWFSPKLREAIDKLHADFQPCALIHDVRWSYGDGSRTLFDSSNREFLYNGQRIAESKYAWYNPIRYVRRHQAAVFANLCHTFGWSAYLTACAKREGAIE